MIIDILRTGQTDWDVESRILGTTDIELNEVGISQAKLVTGRLKNEGYNCIVSSILQRTYTTAKMIFEKQKEVGYPYHIPLFMSNHLLAERNFGKFEGKFQKSVNWGDLPERDGEKVPEGGETMIEFIERVKKGLDQILPEISNRKAIIVSGETTTPVLAHLLTEIPLNQINTIQQGTHYRLEREGAIFVPKTPK